MKRSLALALTAICVLAIAVTAPAIAATRDTTHLSGGGMFASAVGFDPNTTLGVIADVSVGKTTFRSHTIPGNTLTIDTHMLFVQFGQITPDGTGYGYGCWLIPASDFVVNSDLSASLTFDSTDPLVTECPGDPVGGTGVQTSGLVFNLSGPIHLDVTWKPASPVVLTRSTHNTSCHPYFDISQSVTQSVDALPSGSATGKFENPDDPFGGSFQPQFGDVVVSSGQTEFSGFPGICGPLP